MCECYLCGQPATSDDHIPPKCFFPEWKDVGNGMVVFRSNLITLRACDDCNRGRSKDDEYAFVVIASSWRENDIGLLHGQEKIAKIFERSPRLLATLKATLEPVDLLGMKTGAFTLDVVRFYKWLATMARGLWYVDFNRRRRETPVQVCLEELRDENCSRIPEFDTLSKLAASILEQEPWKGENSEVFIYRTACSEQEDIWVAEMVFYEGIRALAFSAPRLNGGY